MDGTMGNLQIGKIYRLQFPGIAARVIEPPAGHRSAEFPFLVESLFLRCRWYVNERGEPDNVHSPKLIVLAGNFGPAARTLQIKPAGQLGPTARPDDLLQCNPPFHPR